MKKTKKNNQKTQKKIQKGGDNSITDTNIHKYVKNYCEDKNKLPSFFKDNPIDKWDVSQVTNMSKLFNKYPNFNNDLSNWDVSQVTDMSGMFDGCAIFNSDLSKWDVSQVTDMSRMFCGCAIFNSDLFNWDVQNVTDMSQMFFYCMNFNSDLSHWDVQNVTDMSQMFFRCEMFNSDLSKWIVSKVTNMSQMFYSCKNFINDLSEWDVSQVTDMSRMFQNCENFNSDLFKWIVSKVTNMSQMFDECTYFNSDLSEWDVSQVTNMDRMFYSCKNFNSNLSKWIVSKVTNMSQMFFQCTKFNSNLSNWVIYEDTKTDDMFALCNIQQNFKPMKRIKPIVVSFKKPIKKHNINNYSNFFEMMVNDPIQGTEQTVKEFLNEDNENIIIVQKENALGLNVSMFEYLINENAEESPILFYECKHTSTTLIPREENVVQNPLFQLKKVGFSYGFVELKNLIKMLTSPHRIFQLKEKKKLKSVINKRLFDSRGNSTSLLVSASHCQEGHSDTLFSLVEKTQSNKSQFNKSQSNKSKSGGKKRKTIKNPKKG